MYSVSDYLRDQAAIRDCEEHWLSPDEDDYMDDYDDDYPANREAEKELDKIISTLPQKMWVE